MNIYQKINEIRNKVAYVKKDTTVGTGGASFRAVSHDQVTAVTRQHFVDVGVIIIPRQTSKGVSVDGTTKSGNSKIRFEAMYEIDFVNMDDGDKITAVVEAHAEGSDDKCAGKALSYATKSAILKVLMLETGEDDEEGIKNTIDAKQTSIIAQLIADTKTDTDMFCQAYSISEVKDLPVVMFAKALAQLQAKKKKVASNADKNDSDKA